MGREKSKLELIKNKKSRILSFHKRKEGLTKKASEISILCGIDVCMIIRCPAELDSQTNQPTIWPENSDEVFRIINKYKKKTSHGRQKSTYSLSNLFETYKKKTEEEITSLRKKKFEEIYPKGEEKVNDFTDVDQLSLLLEKLDNTIESVQNKIDKMTMINENNDHEPLILEAATSGLIVVGSSSKSSSAEQNMELSHVSPFQPLDHNIQWGPFDSSFDYQNQSLPYACDHDPTVSYLNPMMMMNGGDHVCSEFWGMGNANTHCGSWMVNNNQWDPSDSSFDYHNQSLPYSCDHDSTVSNVNPMMMMNGGDHVCSEFCGMGNANVHCGFPIERMGDNHQVMVSNNSSMHQMDGPDVSSVFPYEQYQMTTMQPSGYLPETMVDDESNEFREVNEFGVGMASCWSNWSLDH